MDTNRPARQATTHALAAPELIMPSLWVPDARVEATPAHALLDLAPVLVVPERASPTHEW